MTSSEEILQFLIDRSNEWVSDEDLIKAFQTDRITLLKRIDDLQNKGYQIGYIASRGYRIRSLSNDLTAEEVAIGLETKVFGRNHYIYCPQIDSTNNLAHSLALEGYPEGTVVTAEEQTAGKGRRGREWYSAPGRGIYMSIILKPALPRDKISSIPLLAAVALAEALEESGLKPMVKWPNDILINNKKIAGILAETITNRENIESVILGIGININHNISDFPSGLRTPPTSLKIELGVDITRTKLLQSLLLFLEQHYHLLQTGNFDRTLEKARRLSTIIGKRINYEMNGSYISGIALDLDKNGFLLVKDKKNKTYTITSGEIFIDNDQLKK